MVPRIHIYCRLIRCQGLGGCDSRTIYLVSRTYVISPGPLLGTLEIGQSLSNVICKGPVCWMKLFQTQQGEDGPWSGNWRRTDSACRPASPCALTHSGGWFSIPHWLNDRQDRLAQGLDPSRFNRWDGCTAAMYVSAPASPSWLAGRVVQR